MNGPSAESFIAENFKLRKCQRYAQVDISNIPPTVATKTKFFPTDCVCGNSYAWHQQNGIVTPESADAKSRPWSITEDTTPCACDTFGQLTFRPGVGIDSTEILPGSTAKYIRLDGNNDAAEYFDAVYELMANPQYWRMRKPGLLMEITGSEIDFPHIDQVALKKFNESLMKVAKNSKGWIITNGLDHGVTSMVGQAMEDARMDDGNHDAVCLGIAPWGVIKYREYLAPRQEGGRPTSTAETSTSENNKAAQWKAANYFIDDCKPPGGAVALEHNHTHFLLVDNGWEKRFGEEIDFRARFLDYISKKKMNDYEGDEDCDEAEVPSVLIVIGGGQLALETVEKTLSNSNRPVIVLHTTGGYGGLANLIAYGFEITKDEDQDEKTKAEKLDSSSKEFADKIREHSAMAELLRHTPENQREAKATKFIEIIGNFLENHRDRITVFELGNVVDDAIDRCILEGIFKSLIG